MQEQKRPLTAEEVGIEFQPPLVVTCQHRISSLLVAEHVKNCAAFLGFKAPNDKFVVLGTAFFFSRLSWQRAFLYIVTAKHVLDLVPKDKTPLLRVNLRGGGIKYQPLNRSEWHFHPQHSEQAGRGYKYVDVAVYRTDFDWNGIDFTLIAEEDSLTSEIIEKYSIGTGDEVGITGLFTSHYGESKNIPLVRIGNIAAMPGEPVPTDKGPTEAYLIEARSVAGISGSPVFTHLAVRPERTFVVNPGGKPPDDGEIKEVKKSDKYHYLIGLIQGYYTVTDPNEWVTKSELEAGDINTGIAIVIPVARITETINNMRPTDDDLGAKMHLESIAKSGAKSAGRKVTSTSSESDPPANDASPTHREDFMRLVGAAARKPEPKD